MTDINPYQYKSFASGANHENSVKQTTLVQLFQPLKLAHFTVFIAVPFDSAQGRVSRRL